MKNPLRKKNILVNWEENKKYFIFYLLPVGGPQQRGQTEIILCTYKTNKITKTNKVKKCKKCPLLYQYSQLCQHKLSWFIETLKIWLSFLQNLYML